jgi:hypothetical protein
VAAVVGTVASRDLKGEELTYTSKSLGYLRELTRVLGNSKSASGEENGSDEGLELHLV